MSEKEEAMATLSTLKQIVSREELSLRTSVHLDERRVSSNTILDAVEAFLFDWDSSNQQSCDNNSVFCVKSNTFNAATKRCLRRALSSVVAGLGPGVEHLRQRLMNLVSASKTIPCLLIALDALPATMPLHDDDSASAQQCARQLVGLLKAVLSTRTREPSCVVPIMECMSIIMSLEAQRLENKANSSIDASNELHTTFVKVSVDSLPIVAATDLPCIIEMALKHAVNEDHIIQILNACRVEPRLWMGDSEVVSSVIRVLIQGIKLDKQDQAISVTETYVNLLEDAIKEHKESIRQDKLGIFCFPTEKTRHEEFVPLDLVVLQTIRNDPNHREKFENILDSMLTHFIFPWQSLSTLIRVVKTFLGSSCTKTIERIPDLDAKEAAFLRMNPMEKDLLDLFLFLLVAPLRMPWNGASVHLKSNMKRTKDAMLELHENGGKALQAMMVRSLLNVSWKLSLDKRSDDEATSNLQRRSSIPIKSFGENCYGDVAQLVCESIQEILVHLAKTDMKNLLPFHQSLFDLMARPHCCYTAVKQTCVLLSLLVVPEGEDEEFLDREQGDGIDATMIVTEMWRLLFETPWNASFFDNKQEDDNEKVRQGPTIRGICLGTELVRNSKLCYDTKTNMVRWVNRILLKGRRIHPEIGTMALRLLSVLHDQDSKLDSPATMKVQSNGTIRTNAFRTVRILLSNTGLVREGSNKNGRLSDFRICYESRPAFFSWDPIRPRKVRSMVLCSGTFASKAYNRRPKYWSSTNEWVFNLLNTYLAMGRQRSRTKLSGSMENWVPYGWVEASIEIPLVKLSEITTKNKRQEAAFKWVSLSTAEIAISLESFNNHEKIADRDVCDLLLNLTNPSKMNDFIDTQFHLAHSLLIGMASASAILQNSFAHFHAMTNSFSLDRNSRKMLQYQLVKIYDLEWRCKLLETVFRAIKLASRRRNMRGTSKSRKRKVDVAECVDGAIMKDNDCALHQLSMIRLKTFGTEDMISSDIMWTCLIDAESDKLILGMIEGTMNGISNGSVELDIMTVINLRICTLSHLIDRVQKGLSFDCLFIGTPRSRLSYIDNCLKMACSISSSIPNLRQTMQNGSILDKLAQLTARYFRLVLVMLISSYEFERTSISNFKSNQTNDQNGRVKVEDFLDIYERNFCPRNSKVYQPKEEENNVVSRRDRIQCIMKGFLGHLRMCFDARILNQLLETLTVLSLCSNSNVILSRLVDIHWSALHTHCENKEGTIISIATPYVLQHAIQRSVDIACFAKGQTSPKQQALIATVMKTSKSYSWDSQNRSILVASMLRHWGLLAGTITLDFHRSNAHISHLLDLLKNFVSDICKEFPKDRNMSREDDTSDEEYIPPKSHRTFNVPRRNSEFPGLNSSSLPVYYEALLHMAVGLLAVSASAIPNSNSSGNNDDVDSPFAHLESLAKNFGELIGLFMNHIDVFPRRVTSIVFNASKSMISASMWQLHQCIEWRNSQPMPSVEEKEAGVKDIASIQYLQDLTNSLWVHVIDRLYCLCDSVSFGDEDSDPKSNGAGDLQKVNSVRSALDKARHSIEMIVRSHHLTQPKQSSRSNNGKLGHALEQSITYSVQDLRHFELDDFTRNNLHQENTESSSRNRRHQSPNDGMKASDCTNSLNDDISESSESFGAAGDWGITLEDEKYKYGAGLQQPIMFRQS